MVTNQATALSNERTVLTLLGSRLTASVQLIAAMGGGWDSADIEADRRAARPGRRGPAAFALSSSRCLFLTNAFPAIALCMTHRRPRLG